MLNKERPEVIEQLIEYTTNPMYGIVDVVEELRLAIESESVGQMRKALKIWLNEEYVEPFKVTQAEKYILESVQDEYEWIYRESEGTNYLIISVNKPNSYRNVQFNATGKYQDFRCFNHLFKFITIENSPLKIGDILNNCEVVDDVD